MATSAAAAAITRPPLHGFVLSCLTLKLPQAIDKAYGLTKTGNSEVRFLWHKLCLRAKALFIVPHVLDFVTSMVRTTVVP